ncbi:hypothetical protein JCM8208_005475 [Rhodotorula glutinis]
MAAPLRKPPKLRFDTKYGPAPSLDGKYKSASQFERMYRAYQWTQGFDVEVKHDEPHRVVLACATHRLCPFSLTALHTIFTHPELAGQPGFHLAPDPFHPLHDHAAPFVPLDVDAENARRAHLEQGDPAIEAPPLVRAPSASEGPRAVAAADAANSSVGAARRVTQDATSRDTPWASSSTARASVEAQAAPGPHLLPPPPPAASFREFALPSSSRASSVAVAAAERLTEPQPTPRAQPASASVSERATRAAERTNPFRPLPRPSPTRSTIPPPSPSPSHLLAPSQTPLGSYLSLISPSLVAHLPALATGGLATCTPGSALVELDSGQDGDRAVLDLVRDAAGTSMSLFEAVLVADGTRKAKRRLLDAADDGGQGEVDPRISYGLEKARMLKFLEGRIEVGRAAAEAAAAAAREAA